jgi:hypothetical protein
MKIKIMLRGIYLRLWERLHFTKKNPNEFLAVDKNRNSNIPAHLSISKLCIGPSGFTFHGFNPYSASQLYYDFWGNIKTRNFS